MEGQTIQWKGRQYNGRADNTMEGQTIQWKGRQYHCQKEKGQKGETTIYKALHRKLKIEQHEPHNKLTPFVIYVHEGWHSEKRGTRIKVPSIGLIVVQHHSSSISIHLYS
jgi:hypothetical protein